MSVWKRVYAERRRVLLPVIALLAINAGVLLLGVLPLRRSLSVAQQSAIDARLDLANARRQEAQTKAQRDSRDRAIAELQKFYDEILPKSIGHAREDTNFWLQDVALESRIRFHSGAWQPDDVRDSRLMVLSGQVTLTGDYADIRKFLYHVETAKPFVIIDAVELSQSSGLQNEGAIELDLTVSTYYLPLEAREAGTK